MMIVLKASFITGAIVIFKAVFDGFVFEENGLSIGYLNLFVSICILIKLSEVW